ncbi:unnamed protein product, partial [Polarella glacialis]
ESPGLQLAIRRRRRRLLVAMTVVRSLNAAGIGLIVSASTNLLYELARTKQQERKKAQNLRDSDSQEAANSSEQADDETKGDEVALHRQVQQISTNIGTIATLVDFILAPIIGRFMDAFGRLPTMAFALGCTSFMRLGLAAAPSLRSYIAYR